MTLAEILLATALIAVAALALVGVQLASLRLGRQRRQHWAASQLLRDEMVRVQDMSPDFYPTVDVLYSDDPASPSGFPPAPYPGASRDGVEYKISVRHQPSGSQGHLFTVKVSWGDGSSQMSTLVGP